MDWQGHDLVILEAKYLFHDFSNSVNLDGDSLILLIVLSDIIGSLNYLSVLQLGLHELS